VAVTLAVGGALLMGACGHDSLGGPAEVGFAGPLYVKAAVAEHPEAGAAGDIVDCGTWGDGGFERQDVYSEGATAGSPSDALTTARSEAAFGGVPEGLRVAAQDDDRVLYVLEVAGVIKQAVIVHDGPATEGAGGPGWYVESWAVCDYSELPRSFTDSIGLQIWTDHSGHPVPTTRVASWVGPEHCDWQSMTFLHLGKGTYVRDPQPEVADYFDMPYRSETTLPHDAVDTGYTRDGKHLWLAADSRQAYVGTAGSVEAWPRTNRSLGCA
jgi:hypothetical protein